MLVPGYWMKRRFFVSIHGAVELVEIPNNKYQMTNKYQCPKSQTKNQYMILKKEHIV
jgi:hypothetical protein